MKKILICSISIMAIVMIVGTASALPEVLYGFNLKYDTFGSRLDNCDTCHISNKLQTVYGDVCHIPNKLQNNNTLLPIQNSNMLISLSIGLPSSMLISYGSPIGLSIQNNNTLISCKLSIQNNNNNSYDNTLNSYGNMYNTLNPYGLDLKNNLNLGISGALSKIESLDSDKDGHSNIDEINNLTFPGDNKDFSRPANVKGKNRHKLSISPIDIIDYSKINNYSPP